MCISQLGLKLFHIEDFSYKISVQPNSGTQANERSLIPPKIPNWYHFTILIKNCARCF